MLKSIGILIDDFLYAGIPEKLFMLLCLIVFLAFVSMVLMLIFYGFDSLFRPSYVVKGIVKDKYYKEPYTTTTFIYAGKVMVPQIIHHDETWNMEIEVQDGVDTITVKKSFYEKTKIGQFVNVRYSKGRLSNSIYIKDIGELSYDLVR